ncbi:MAG: hypothetical protein WBD47_10370 [Phormidesmis sp.]
MNDLKELSLLRIEELALLFGFSSHLVIRQSSMQLLPSPDALIESREVN